LTNYNCNISLENYISTAAAGAFAVVCTIPSITPIYSSLIERDATSKVLPSLKARNLFEFHVDMSLKSTQFVSLYHFFG